MSVCLSVRPSARPSISLSKIRWVKPSLKVTILAGGLMSMLFHFFPYDTDIQHVEAKVNVARHRKPDLIT